MIVDDERDTYARNFVQLSSYGDVANDISQSELLDDTFSLLRGIFKIIYNFVIGESIKNYRQTW